MGQGHIVHAQCAMSIVHVLQLLGVWVVNIQGLLRGQVLVSLTMQLTEADAVIALMLTSIRKIKDL